MVHDNTSNKCYEEGNIHTFVSLSVAIVFSIYDVGNTSAYRKSDMATLLAKRSGDLPPRLESDTVVRMKA